MAKQDPEIIYEDEAIVVANKPPKYLTLPDRYATGVPNLYEFLTRKYGKIFILHRLDKETSGILIFAKTEDAHRELSRQFQERSVEKTYLTLVEGRVHHAEGSIDKPLAEHSFIKGRMVVSRSGKASLTHYRVLEHFKKHTLVEARIMTGRMHQIRVHFQAIGYPLVVDKIYGRQDAFYLSDIKGSKYSLSKHDDERPLMDRSALHAARLVFDHPNTGARTSVEAPLPKDFAAVLNQLRKWNA